MNNTNVTQLDWNFMYGTNYLNNLANPGSSSRYMLERRHNNLMEIPLNVTYDNQLNESLKLIAGVEAKYSKGMHYKNSKPNCCNCYNGKLYRPSNHFFRQFSSPS